MSMFRETVIVLVALAFSALRGTDGLQKRMINGATLDDDNFNPIVVRLHNNSNPRIAVNVCTGTIIGRRWVLTSQDCKQDLMKYGSTVTVQAGINDISQDGFTSTVVYGVTHPKADWENNQFAVSLLFVNPPFVWSKSVAPAVLPEANVPAPAEAMGVVAGWGAVDENFEVAATHLQQATLLVLSDGLCEWIKGEKYHQSLLCAKDMSKSVGMCYADEGGPLVVDGVLHGLVHSLPKIACQNPSSSQVFMKISAVRDWIRYITGI